MIMNELMLATMLLNTPPGIPETPPPIERWPAIKQAIQTVAFEAEILDKSEKNYILAELRDFTLDLDILRKRVVELSDAPRAIDANRFPDRRVSGELIQFNRAFRQNLVKRRAANTHLYDEYNDAISETDRLYHIWDAIRDARCDYYHVTVRRQSLKKLKQLLGDEDYFQAKLPPNVPTWRFMEE
jgi:hypothetical protein